MGILPVLLMQVKGKTVRKGMKILIPSALCLLLYFQASSQISHSKPL
jgi:hypothetical protein